MLAIEGADKDRYRLLLVKHTHVHNTKIVKLTRWMLSIEGADKERNRLLLVKQTHIHNTRQFSTTHLLMLTMD